MPTSFQPLGSRAFVSLFAALAWCSLVVSSSQNLAAEEEFQNSDADAEAVNPPPAGHSMHGEAFNEGPRQAAYHMPGTGRVHFAITTSDPRAQAFFEQGLGQLHGFWYFEAERAFRQAARFDPDCAMAYWGMAMANEDNLDRARELIAEAHARRDAVSTREARWIDIYRPFLDPEEGTKDKERFGKLLADLQSLVDEYPADFEARAMLALYHWRANSHGVPIEDHESVNDILLSVLNVEPMHPGALHYTVHLWDREDAERAVPAAARIGPATPAIAHMWHMAGHIYDKLKRYDDAAWQQEASARVDHAYMRRDRVMPYLIHNYAHNQEWCVRSLIKTGRASDAVRLAMNLTELPRHPRFNTYERSSSCASYGRRRLFEALVQFELWQQLIDLTESPYLEPTDDPQKQAQRLHARGLAMHRLNRSAEAGNEAEMLQVLLDNSLVKAIADVAVAHQDFLANQEAANEAEDASRNVEQEEEDEENDEEEDDEKRMQKRLRSRLRSAARRSNSLRNAIAAYLDELQAWQQVADGHLELAVESFTKKKKIPRERRIAGLLACGQANLACESAEKAVKSADNQVLPLARHVEALHAANRSDDAAKALEQLRALSAQVDLEMPLFSRVTEIATGFGMPLDWRLESDARQDLGVRPPLDDLGPLAWTPMHAEPFALPDSNNATVELQRYAGRPVVLIFYLGLGCLHCVEQLEEFAPYADEFQSLGIELLGVSTDPVEKLRESEERFGQFAESGKFPFPLVSDAALDVFKQYRAYDDFEEMALHATVLIDADGLVRWQDISYEPFTDPEFLLQEAQRLLSQDTSATLSVEPRPTDSPRAVASSTSR